MIILGQKTGFEDLKGSFNLSYPTPSSVLKLSQMRKLGICLHRPPAHIVLLKPSLHNMPL